MRGLLRRSWLEVLSFVVAATVFGVPLVFMVFTASKSQAEASHLDFAPPTDWRIWENLTEVLTVRDHLVVTAMRNSIVLTATSVALTVLFGAMVGYVLQRRNDWIANVVTVAILAGLILPPAVVPTIYVLQQLGIFKSLISMILLETTFQLPFAVIVFRAFIGTIPREIDEAAIVDGASPLTTFLKIILPLLRPAVITVVVVSAVSIYNDFVNPLYFLPGDSNATVQLTLFNFQSQFTRSWNLLFMDVILITIPPLIMFAFFSEKIVSGMAAGAVKG